MQPLLSVLAAGGAGLVPVLAKLEKKQKAKKPTAISLSLGYVYISAVILAPLLLHHSLAFCSS